ncbi:PAS domain-containing protein [Sphingomonas jaspsi]|uniref:PAS domain-containing protein n=1 Tax=Sphingomonas jaspsi TaxID=392409 RepID=UPI001C54F9BE|nr:PAS domain-containing protein [Sphingomonas jaspsi]
MEELDRHARLALPIFRQLFDLMDEGFCVIKFLDSEFGPDSDYIHIAANAAYARHAGIPNVVGQKLREMVPDEADAWIARYGKVLESGEPIHFEQELVATGRWLRLSAFRLEPADSKLVAVLFQDITRERAAKQELEGENLHLSERMEEAVKERELFATLVQSSDVAVLVVDPDLNIVAANEAASKEFMQRFDRTVEAGHSLVELLSAAPDNLKQMSDRWRRSLAGEEFEVVESFKVGGTTRHIELRMRPLRNSKGDIVGAYKFGHDVTATIAEQTRREAAEDALRQSQKMEAIGQLTGGLAHDFNNLLTAISGSFELIETRLQQGRIEAVEKYLIAGKSATRRAAALTHRLLAFARRQTLTPSPTNLNDALADLCDLIRRTVGPEIEVELVATKGIWTTLVDQNQFENAILNLCINARDAMPGGGQLTIETGNRWVDDAQSAKLNIGSGQYVSVCVSDTGTGIPEEIRERVFDPFFTTKPMGEGTGLGLSMVYGFAKQSDGHVAIYSEAGSGTMVCIYLPRHLGKVTQAAPDRPSAEVHALTNSKVALIVDDEPTVRMLVADALQEVGIATLEAADGIEALSVASKTENIDILVTDVGLPRGMNGRQIADAIKQERHDIPVLFITGYAENAAFNHGHIRHGMEILTKPFSVDELQNRVRRLLSSSKA